MLPLVLSSHSRVFEPPGLWQTRLDATFRDRAPRIERIGGADQIVVEADQILSGIGLISNAGARFEAPETISAQGRFEDAHRIRVSKSPLLLSTASSIMLHISAASEKKPLVVIQKCSQNISRKVFSLIGEPRQDWQGGKDSSTVAGRTATDREFATLGWRRGRDSNPRSPARGTTVFETAPFDRSGTSPARSG